MRLAGLKELIHVLREMLNISKRCSIAKITPTFEAKMAAGAVTQPKQYDFQRMLGKCLSRNTGNYIKLVNQRSGFLFSFLFFWGTEGGGGGGGKEEMRCREEECDRRLQIGRRAPPAARATRGFPARAWLVVSYFFPADFLAKKRLLAVYQIGIGRLALSSLL